MFVYININYIKLCKLSVYHKLSVHQLFNILLHVLEDVRDIYPRANVLTELIITLIIQQWPFAGLV